MSKLNIGFRNIFKCLLVILLIVFIYLLSQNLYNITLEYMNDSLMESLQNNKKPAHLIDYYVITMHQPERLKNIETQIQKSGIPMKMNYVDAVVGKNIDINKLIEDKILSPNIYQNSHNKFTAKFENRKNEVGCYLSHMKTYDIIKQQGNMDNYSIIFEDDFDLSGNFIKVLEGTLETIKHLDFDMLFLGIIGEVGQHIKDNVYHINPKSFQAHAYLVNNKHIDKIITEMRYIDTIVDVQIFKKSAEHKLTVFRIDPTIVYQGNYGTTIRK